MGVKARHAQGSLVWVIVLGAAAAGEFDDLALPGCNNTCGGVPAPYPFGIGYSSESGENCFLEESFELTCDNSTLRSGNVRILNISLSEGNLEDSFLVSRVCYNESGIELDSNYGSLGTAAFTISSKQNKFISVGCDTYGYLNSFQNGIKYSTGCLTRCDGSPDFIDQLNNGSCSGIGCCQVDVPLAMKNITIEAYSFNNYSDTPNFNRCSYSSVAKQGSYHFQQNKLPDEEYPLVVNWAVGTKTCKDAPTTSNYACKNNSDCEPATESRYGYRCRCKIGYEGNPYHLNGCRSNFPFTSISCI